MKIALTSQEKKVIGFILLMVLLGLAVLAGKAWMAKQNTGRTMGFSIQETPSSRPKGTE